MMDAPFSRSQWAPLYSPSFRGIPVQRERTRTSSPKVVSIPVHFVGSESNRLKSSLTIQRVFRGYLVRKNMKRILAISSEVEEVERKIMHTETVDLIRRNERERLRINETLMALLFKLDSIRGVDSGVRDCRKAVIRKAISLQEKVDAIVTAPAETKRQAMVEVDDSNSIAVDQDNNSADSTSCSGESQNSDVQTEGDALTVDPSIECSGPVNGNDGFNQTLKMAVKAPEVENAANETDDVVDGGKELQKHDELAPDSSKNRPEEEDFRSNMQITESGVGSVRKANENPCILIDIVENCYNAAGNATDDSPKLQVHGESEPGSGKVQSEHDDSMSNMHITESGVESEEKTNENPCILKEIVENCDKKTPIAETMEESVETSPENWSEHSANSWSLTEGHEVHTSEELQNGLQLHRSEQTIEGNIPDCSGDRDDTKRSRKLLEKMTDDNEKMLSLMTQLFERNQMQTQVLTSLTQRVEELEKAFLSDRLRRKKKKKRNNC